MIRPQIPQRKCNEGGGSKPRHIIQTQERKGSETTESTIYLADNNIAAAVFGQEDKNLKQVERALSAKIHARGSEISLSGSEEEIQQAVNVFNHLQALAEAGVDIDQLAVGYALASRHQGRAQHRPTAYQNRVYHTPGSHHQAQNLWAVAVYSGNGQA